MSSMSRERRGPGKVERSKSGGAVRGKIPKAGGSNKTNFETGISVIKYGKDKPKAMNKTMSKAKPIKAMKKTVSKSKSIASKGMGNGKST